MSAELSRVRIAIDRLDAAGQEEGITPDTYLGAWAVAQRDLLEAQYAYEQTREMQMLDMTGAAKATAEANAEAMRHQAEAMQVELRKIDRFIEQARISLGQKESDTVQALVDGIAAKADEVMVSRARAWSRTRYLQTAGALAFAGFLLLGGGYWAGASRPGNGAPSDFLQQCVGTLRRDAVTGRTFCAVEMPSQR